MKVKDIGRIISTGPKLGERQIRVRASTENRDRVGDEVVLSGLDVSAYRANPIVLAEHNREAPIGTATDLVVKNGALECVINFAPLGASERADEYCALAKAGVLGAVSIGFIEKECSPIKGGGVRISKAELLEISLVSCPANSEAIVLERSIGARRQSVFGPRAKADPRAKRMRDAERLALKHASADLSRAERDAEVRRLKAAREITPPSGDPVSFAHQKAKAIHDDALARSAAAYSNAPASEAQRLGDLARLGR